MNEHRKPVSADPIVRAAHIELARMHAREERIAAMRARREQVHVCTDVCDPGNCEVSFMAAFWPCEEPAR